MTKGSQKTSKYITSEEREFIAGLFRDTYHNVSESTHLIENLKRLLVEIEESDLRAEAVELMNEVINRAERRAKDAPPHKKASND